jgi:hypothetical protein
MSSYTQSDPLHTIWVSVFVCVCVRVRIWWHVCVYELWCAPVYVYVCVYDDTYVFMNYDVHLCMCMYVCVCVLTQYTAGIVHTHSLIHYIESALYPNDAVIQEITFIYTWTHTHTQIHTQTHTHTGWTAPYRMQSTLCSIDARTWKTWICQASFAGVCDAYVCVCVCVMLKWCSNMENMNLPSVFCRCVRFIYMCVCMCVLCLNDARTWKTWICQASFAGVCDLYIYIYICIYVCVCLLCLNDAWTWKTRISKAFCVCVSVSVCLCLCLCLCLCVCVYDGAYVCFYESWCACVHVYVSVYVCVWVDSISCAHVCRCM